MILMLLIVGDLLAKQGKEAEAMEQYSLALSLNPKDEASLAGIYLYYYSFLSI
jgi:predicted negative regulator of RcsB-dependent stress response